MKIYRVGGAVRDALLGLPVQDIDYVVLGSTPEQMIAAGFTPVGKDFPVFLHPRTHAEYALARTERKSAPGYHGFVFHCAPDVTLEEDLQRRDLTINAMALSDDSGTCCKPADIIDPFGGQRDLAEKLFRHVSPAFAEDPVRILRIARFSARFPTFRIAPETLQLMRAMVDAGEVDALIPERVWQEIARGLMEQHPARMMTVLHETGALTRIMPELAVNWNQQVGTVTQGQQLLNLVDLAAQRCASQAVRWASMMAELAANCEKHPQHMAAAVRAVQQLCARLKVPAEVRDISILATRERYPIEQAAITPAQEIVGLFERCDAFRRPQRFAEVVQAVTLHLADDAPHNIITQSLRAVQEIASGRIAQAVAVQFPGQPQKIAEQILIARIAAVANCLIQTRSPTNQTLTKS